MTTPGTFREVDGGPVRFLDAVAGWAEVAFSVLLEIAHSYNSVISYKELGEHVQVRTGTRTKMLLTNWIGKVLEAVARECHVRGELPLTALCVRQDGTVGDGYASAMGRYGDGVPTDPEMHAAEMRLACYRKYALDLPADGGQASLTSQEAARRRAAAPAPAVQLCPIHHTALPRTGVCDDCA